MGEAPVTERMAVRDSQAKRDDVEIRQDRERGQRQYQPALGNRLRTEWRQDDSDECMCK